MTGYQHADRDDENRTAKLRIPMTEGAEKEGVVLLLYGNGRLPFAEPKWAHLNFYLTNKINVR